MKGIKEGIAGLALCLTMGFGIPVYPMQKSLQTALIWEWMKRETSMSWNRK